MTTIDQYNSVLTAAREGMRELLRKSAETYDWLLTSESDDAMNEIAVIAVMLLTRGMPVDFAIAYAVKAYSEKLEVA